MNLRKQVEPLKKAALQASSLQRHAHHAASRLTWVKRWLKRAYRHHAQSRELEPSATDPIGSEFTVQERAALSVPAGDATSGHQKTIDQPFELAGALSQFAAANAGGVAAAKQFVRDIEGSEDRQPQRVAGGRLVGGQAYLLVDVAREPRHVGLIQRTAD